MLQVRPSPSEIITKRKCPIPLLKDIVQLELRDPGQFHLSDQEKWYENFDVRISQGSPKKQAQRNVQRHTFGSLHPELPIQSQPTPNQRSLKIILSVLNKYRLFSYIIHLMQHNNCLDTLGIAFSHSK